MSGTSRKVVLYVFYVFKAIKSFKVILVTCVLERSISKFSIVSY